MSSASATLTFAEHDAIRARARLVSSAISGRAKDRRRHRLRLARGIVRVQTLGNLGPLTPALYTRGPVGIWSDRSRGNFRDHLAEIDWPRAAIFLATLTYPGCFEADPAAWKADLFAFFAAWRRQYGPVLCVWILEFQRRGAPHFHIAIIVPDGTKSADMREWVAQTWYRIAGHGDRRHLNQHRKTEHFKRADGHQGVSAYFQRELRKEHQKQLPDWLVERAEGAGRWWGIRGLERVIRDLELTEREAHKLRRVAGRILRGRDDELIARLETDRDRLVDEILPYGDAEPGRLLDDLKRVKKALRRARARRLWPGWKWRSMKLYDRTPSPWGLAELVSWYLALVRGEAPAAHGSLARMDLRATEQLRIGPPITATQR